MTQPRLTVPRWGPGWPAGLTMGFALLALVLVPRLGDGLDFRLVCDRPEGTSSDLLLEVARAEHVKPGTTFTMHYGDGSTATHEDGLGGIGWHSYRQHGTYDITARLHLPTNEVRDYSRTCSV